ncbi:MAG: HIT domain-containing protein [Dysgonamonadaceae bacterium]|nr:HIT domain-containing protein [Dysgonamonadaceae bacterium]
MDKNSQHHPLLRYELDGLSQPMRWLLEKNLLQGKILIYGTDSYERVLLSKKGYDIEVCNRDYQPTHPKEKFDTIISIYLFNWLDNIEQNNVLLSVSRLLKHGGKAYFAVKHHFGFKNICLNEQHEIVETEANVTLPFKKVFQGYILDIYKFQHFNIINRNRSQCPYCSPQQEVMLENEYSYAMLSNSPISKGHTLVIPKRHVANYFDLTINEQIACQLTLNRLKKIIDEEHSPDGYSVSINMNAWAGQGVDHVAIELVARYENSERGEKIGFEVNK